MRMLLLPLFVARLVLSLVPFFIKLLFASFKFSISLIIILIVFILTLLSLIRFFITKKENNDFQLKVYTYEQQKQEYLKQEKSKLEKQLKLQPSHRDILINLDKIVCELGETTCGQYKDRAFQLDPNGEKINQ